jgi:hypothetical protein
MAHRRLARIPLPVGVRDKRHSGVEGASRRDTREVQGERQITLQPLEAEQEQHRHHGETEQREQIRAPTLIGVGVDANDSVEGTLDTQVLGASEDPRHVVAEWPVGKRQKSHQKEQLEDACGSCAHQNFSGKRRAASKYPTRAIAMASATAFAAFTTVPAPSPGARVPRRTARSIPRRRRRAFWAPGRTQDPDGPYAESYASG